MDYEKKYKEALERAKNTIEINQAIPDIVECVESLFPELVESGDEEIRKSITEFFKNYSENGTWKAIPDVTKWIDWLEKQGEQDNNEDVDILHRFSFYSYKDEPNILYLAGLYVNEEYRNKGIGTKILEVADEVAKSLNCHAIRLKTKKDSDAERLYRTHGYNSLVIKDKGEIWLEKQCESKPACKIQVSDELYEHIRNTCACIDDALSSKSFADINDYLSMAERSAQSAFEMIEKQGEQNPDDKAEPKFKVGDWCIDNEDGTIFQIVKVLDNTYTYKTNKGKEYSCSHYSLENDARFWTIQDAKDGDVLFTSSTASHETFIFKGIDEKGNAECYFAYDSEDGFREGKYHFIGRATDCKPATKEQRDILFAKMEEFGYKWDNKEKELFGYEPDIEKKELKEIKQKPTDKIEPKFKVGDWIVECAGADAWLITKVFTTEENIIAYNMINQEGRTLVIGSHNIDYRYHLWTIQDAKDGDVLVDEGNNIGIYKEIEGLCWHSYIYLGNNNCLYGFSIGGSHMQSNTKPATKEQYDNLFAKMKEAGYKWDSEKRELKKINSYCQEHCKGFQETCKCFADWECKAKREAEAKQKPAEWSEEDERLFQIIIDILNRENLLGNISFTDLIACVRKLKSIKPQPQKEWSEEDESRMDNLCHFLEEYGNQYYGHLTLQGTISWLKFLKDRVQPQPRPIEWSDEDEKMLNDILMCGEHHCYLDAENIDWLKSLKGRVQLQPNKEWGEDDENRFKNLIELVEHSNEGNGTKNGFVKFINRLKSLKPHPKQEWSEEDEYYYGIIQYIINGECVGKTDEENAINWFKSLKPRPKQEWSEEDKRNASYICAALECYYRLREERNNTNGQEDLNKARNWLYNKLKSLNPQNSWKPSDEQITWLYRAADEASKDSCMKQILNELLSDLKKLKGE